MYTYNNSYGDTTYLDLFLEDCINNKDKHNALIKEKNKGGKFIIILFLICFFATFLSILIKPGITFIFFGLTFFSVFIIIVFNFSTIGKRNKLEEDIYSGGDGIEYSNIDSFLETNQMSRFDDFEQSFCVNNKSIEVKKTSKKTSFITFFILWGLCPISSLVLGILNNINVTKIDFIMFVVMMSIFSGVSIGMFVWGLFPIIRKYIVCNYQTNAVCVEVYSKISRDSDGDRTTVYRPFYYVKHESLGYILCPNSWSNVNVPEVGDLKEKFYINPNNPFEYRVSGEWKMFLFYLIFVVAFIAPFIITLGNIILNGGF